MKKKLLELELMYIRLIIKYIILIFVRYLNHKIKNNAADTTGIPCGAYMAPAAFFVQAIWNYH